MRYILISLVLSSFIFADNPLSTQKEKILQLQREKLNADANKLQNSWITPLKVQARWQKSVNAGKFGGRTASVGLSLNQDIFRSGGIWYAIDYAKAYAQLAKLGVDIQEASLLKRIYTLKIEIQRDELKLQQAKLLLKNRQIDLDVIKDNYKAGNSDISQLNRASIDSDNALVSLINAKTLLQNERYELKKLTGKRDIKELKIPAIPLVDKESYLAKNLEILKLKKEIETNKALYKTTKAKYLPKVTIQGNYGYSKFRGDFQNYQGKEYNYAAQLSIPIDINTKNDLQSNKVNYLQSQATLKDKRWEFENEYEKHINNIKNTKDKIKISKKMINMYNELYQFSKSQVKAGLKTDLDLKSLENSIKIQKLSQKIEQKNILLEKIQLFFAMKTTN